MRRRKFQVFVSSTYEDLRAERSMVMQSILEAGCIPVGMEIFPATDRGQWDHIKSVIDECDYYLVILAGRYGTLARGMKKSYTEMEFDYAAKKARKPILAFLHQEIDGLPSARSETSEAGRVRLNRFQEKLKKQRIVRFWKGVDELARIVGSSLAYAIQEYPSPGLIRLTERDEAAVIFGDLRSASDLGNHYVNIINGLRAAFYRENVVAEVRFAESSDATHFEVEDKITYTSRALGGVAQQEIVLSANPGEFASLDKVKIVIRGATNSDRPQEESLLLDASSVAPMTDGSHRVCVGIPESHRGDSLFVSISLQYKLEKHRYFWWHVYFGYGLALTITFPERYSVLSTVFLLDDKRIDVTERTGYYNLRYSYWMTEGSGIAWQMLEKKS